MEQPAAAMCVRCGEPLPPNARFCPSCGAPVAVVATEERKIVTVLFADIAGSTELATRLDPERFREMMGGFYNEVSEELEALRGRAEKFVGDAVMAVFGIPHAHEDDAVRAIRAGIVIRERMERLDRELGLPLPLKIRVGINTGSVATGSGPTDQLLVSGAAINLAARLQEAAQPNEILVGETTRMLARDSVEFGEERVVAAKGFDEGVRAWPVVGLTTRSSRRTIPLVDRRREVALLRDTFDRAVAARRPHLFTLLGPVGIGKSRLLEEFVAGVPDGTRVLTTRVNEFAAAFSPIADLLRREIDVERGADLELVRSRLAGLVAECCEPDEVPEVTTRLGTALGLPGPEREGQPRRGAELRSGLLALFEGMAEQGPVVFMVEDLHAAKEGFLDLMERLLEDAPAIPLLLICAARDWLIEERPSWGKGAADAVTLRLEPLSDDEAKLLALAAGDGIDEAVAERIVRQAGGNPFFIIETTGMLLQRHREHVTGVAHSHLLPPTVQAVVASRIDHLPEDARELLRRASVFPRASFSSWELSLITDARPELLETLEDSELLVGDEDRVDRWRFRHEMLRDVAYDSLPKRERVRLHVAVAQGLRKERPGRLLREVAYHLEQAAKASLDLDPNDRRLADEAIEALAAAGDRARWAIESSTAVDLYERALALADAPERWGQREAEILSGLGESRYWLGDYEEATSALRHALEHSEERAWTRAHAARFLGDIALNVDGDPDRAEDLFEQALETARGLDERYTLARTLLMAGWVPFWREDLDRARALFEEALQVARENPAGDRWAEARALTSLASTISPVGDEAECLELARQALAIGEEMKDAFTIAVAKEYVGNSLRRMWQLDDAFRYLDEAVKTFRDLGARWELASTIGDRGHVHMLAGRLAEAERDVRESLRICRALGEKSLLLWTVRELAQIVLMRGEAGEARHVLEQPLDAALEQWSRVGFMWSNALVALVEGDRERGRALAAEALDTERRSGHRNPLAASVWWAASLFDDEAAGGPEQVDAARRTLEEAHWLHAIEEPKVVQAALGL